MLSAGYAVNALMAQPILRAASAHSVCKLSALTIGAHLPMSDSITLVRSPGGPPSASPARQSSAERISIPVLIWWTAPAPGIEVCHSVIVADESHEGSRPNANYHDRVGYRQERVPGSRDRRGREGHCEEATSTQPGADLLQGAAALPHRHGGLRHGALLGAGVDEAGSQGSSDAGEGCEGVRQAQQERCCRR